ncbi:MAG: electron transfer flavoprotein subunit beta/FixA family protein [Rhodoferax sp.]
MHILVPVKRVVDYNVKVRVKTDGSAVDTAGVKMSINPFDEVALEQAVRMKEKGLATKVTVVTCGAAVCQDVLRTGLAMGADAAILIDNANAPLESLGVAKLLCALAQREQVGMVLCGKQAIDDDLGAAGPMLAALLDWPQAVSVNRLSLEGSTLDLSCDGDQGMEQWHITAPAVLTVDLRLCDPRSITLPNMMKAKKATITTVAAADLAVLATPKARVTSVAEPAARPAGIKVANIAELIGQIKKLPMFNT